VESRKRKRRPAVQEEAEPQVPSEQREGQSEKLASQTTKPATTKPAEKGLEPEVEVYIPSVAGLREAAAHSDTARLYQALSGMFPSAANETDEGFDLAAVFDLVEQIADWPDTSLVVATYTPDREGRPRWAVRVDWSLDDLGRRIEELLEAPAARRILKDVKLNKEQDAGFRIELPDYLLAVVSPSGGGAMISSACDVKLPAMVFGQEAADQQASEGPDGKRKAKKPMLVYSRLNLAAAEEGEASPFAQLSGVRDVCYGLSLDKDRLWTEKLVVRWNPLLGTALKLAFRTTSKSFECPRGAYAVAAFNLAVGEQLADGISDLPSGTIGPRVSGEAAVAVVPGVSFFPFPDVFFQFHTSRKEKIIDSIREAIAEDTRKRKEEIKPPAWREQKIDGEPVFWRDPTADAPAGLAAVTYRTVVFFEGSGEEEAGARTRLIIAQTSAWADDAVGHWRELNKGRKSRITIPDSKQAHWQARLSWKKIYELAQPYLSLLAAVGEDTLLPPGADELSDVLVDSVIDVRIDYSGLTVRHRGPIPFGAVYVPGVAATSLSSRGNEWTEIGRERTACRHLRVLYHHAKLFKGDYSRWPATVAELDGYVDFASHRDLLWLQPKQRAFMERVATAFTGPRQRDAEAEDVAVDDSLYEIEWSVDNWRLRFRDGEFKNYQTIYIDKEGEIHRVSKSADTQPGEDE
jgi:hypothetical protein